MDVCPPVSGNDSQSSHWGVCFLCGLSDKMKALRDPKVG